MGVTTLVSIQYKICSPQLCKAHHFQVPDIVYPFGRTRINVSTSAVNFLKGSTCQQLLPVHAGPCNLLPSLREAELQLTLLP